MPLRFLLDESVRGGGLWQAIADHNRSGIDLLDAVRVGDPSDLPLGAPDPEILLWAEREGRILLTGDRRTMPGHLADHLQAGHTSPGVFVIRPASTLPAIVAFLVLAAHTSTASSWENRIEFIP
jgi:hypothetical protein